MSADAGDVCAGYPPDHINAVITHTIHFLGLLAFYLGIKLPFEVVWAGPQAHDGAPGAGGGRFGVGIPWIGAGRGGEAGSWAKCVPRSASSGLD